MLFEMRMALRRGSQFSKCSVGNPSQMMSFCQMFLLHSENILGLFSLGSDLGPSLKCLSATFQHAVETAAALFFLLLLFLGKPPLQMPGAADS